VAPHPQVAPAGFRLATAGEVLTGAALVGRSILHRGPVQGWVLGKVEPGGWVLSHGVRYARPGGSALGVGEAASLLDAPSHGPGPAGRWVLLARPSFGFDL
jgi:hypothetical protein